MMKVPKNPYSLSLFTYTHYMRKPIHILYAFFLFCFTDENEPAVASNNEDEEDDGIYINITNIYSFISAFCGLFFPMYIYVSF